MEWRSDGRIRAEAPGRRIVRLSGLFGTPVFRASGERWGRFCDISIERRSGRVAFALIAVEAPFGGLDSLIAAPWGCLRYDAARSGYVALTQGAGAGRYDPVSREDLRRLGAGDEAWNGWLAMYYGPYLISPFI